MNNLAKKLSLVFSAGLIGGLINSLAVWIFGIIGITSALGVKIAPSLSASWLYPCMGRNLGFTIPISANAKAILIQRVDFQFRANRGATFDCFSHQSKQRDYGS